MDKFILSLKKRTLLPIVFLVGFLIWLSLCKANYDSYWYGTIQRVQTVDFNLMHHCLPTTISELILSGRDKSLQKVLDSTYGLFGLVITDPSGKNIIYKTDAIYKSKSWQKFLSPEYLNKQGEPYDLLYDPPPLAAQHSHASPRQEKADNDNSHNEGRVIGRIYYLRGVAPPFLQDLIGAISTNWMEFTGSKRGYILLTLTVLGFALSLIFVVLWRQQELKLRAQELQRVERELDLRRKAVDHLNTDLLSQRQRKEWLEKEADTAYKRALALKESLEKMKEAFFLIDMSPDKQDEKKGMPAIAVRPPLHPASKLIEEVENLLPDLSNNAKILRSQAEVLQSYCTQLEIRQAEMQKIIDETSANQAVLGQRSNSSPIELP